MEILDSFEVVLPNGKLYENELSEYGHEWEFLDGAGLKNGHYCKFYCKKRDWRGDSGDKCIGLDGRPALQHFCAKSNKFMGFAYCCGTVDDCYEEGKSAGVKRLLNKLRKARSSINFPDPELSPGDPDNCAGNVERGGFSCDECDHFLKCFPECDPGNDDIYSK